MKHNSFLLLIVCMCMHMVSLAQSEFDRYKEIRLSHKYFYGEAVGADTVAIKDEAMNALVSNIAQYYLDTNHVNSAQDSALYVKQAGFFVFNYGMQKKAVAYIDTQQVVLLQKTPAREMNVVEMIVANDESKQQAGENDGANVPKDMHSQAGNDNAQGKDIHSQRMNAGARVKDIDNQSLNNSAQAPKDIHDQLTGFRKASELTQFLNRSSRRNMLAYTEKENAVMNKEDCYIMVVKKSENVVLACLSKGKGQRVNLFDNETIGNFKSKYSNAEFIWVYVY